SDGQAPNAANDYFSDAFNIRTPQVSSPTTNFFAGKSLSLDTGGGLFHKYTAAANVTIPDLRLNGGTVLMAAGNSIPFTLWGAITVTANSVLDLNNYTNSPLTIYAPISGSADLKVQGASTSGNYVRLLGDNSAFSGNWNLSSGSLVIGNGGSSGSPGLGNINLGAGMALTINRSGTLMVPGMISGNASLTKAGSGTLILSGYNSYSRSTTISAGTLKLDGAGAIASSPSITVASGATLDVSSVSGGFTLSGLGAQSVLGSGSVVGNVSSFGGSAIVPGGTNVAGTLTFSNDLALNYGDTLVFDLASATTVGSGTNDLIVVNGNLSLGYNTVVINPLGLLAGTYRLINYTGTKTGSLSPTVLGTRYTCTIDESTPGQINLVVSGSPANLVWTGQNGSSWDIQSSYNWNNAGTADVFYNGDSVAFDDAAGMTPVDLNAALAPSAITVNFSGTNTFQGPGALLGAASLTKDGSGTLILDNAGPNNYSGPTTINAGTLQIGNYDKNGSLGAGPVVNNGTLVFTRSDAVTLPNSISGTGNLSFLGSNTVTLTGHSTFTGKILTGAILKMSSEDALGDNPPTFSATQLMMGTFNSTNAALCVTNGGIQATASFTIASLNRGIAIAYANSYKPLPN
ncbi:MAG TPA: autotransporter-associated beta strand repeat-containing protein, partial [Candidatus Sulfotelmatobacter sp.]|nr:autotransporter-associated beta strand repeat-containing protein [Candidatus Sulfotelmatobacter sp.]